MKMYWQNRGIINRALDQYITILKRAILSDYLLDILPFFLLKKQLTPTVMEQPVWVICSIF